MKNGFLVTLVGALVGDLLLGALGATPYLLNGGSVGDLGVIVLFGTFFGFTRPYSIVMHLALWAGSPAGAWLALRQQKLGGPGRTAIALLIFHGVAVGAVVLVALLGFGNKPLIFYRFEAGLVLIALLVVLPLLARAYVVWRGGAAQPAPVPTVAH